MKYDNRTCAGCGKPTTSLAQRDISHFILERRTILDSEHRSWPPDTISFCAIECLAEGVVRLFNDSLMSDWATFSDA